MKQSVFFRNFVLMGLATVVMAPAFAKLKVTPPKPPQLQGTQYCQDEAKINSLESIVHLDERNQIDRIVILKKTKQLHLLSQGRVYKTYKVNFGAKFLEGNKVQEKDDRTPEGLYYVEAKNPNSQYHMALKVSYPNAYDKAFAAKYGVSPGGLIMIHGFPNANKADNNFAQWAASDKHLRNVDWTMGCIAVTDEEIEHIYKVVRQSTAIEICPR